MFLTTFTFYLISIFHSANSDRSLRRLEVISQDYNKFDAPRVNGASVKVFVYMTIQELDNIDEGSMDFSIHFFLEEIWTDPRLNLTRFQNHRDGTTEWFPEDLATEIWKPDLVFDNAKDGVIFMISVPNVCIRVFPSGELVRTTRYNLKISCHMFLMTYPMDTQHCHMKTCLNANPDHKAKLHWIAEEKSSLADSYGNENITFLKEISPLKFTLLEPLAYKKTEIWSGGSYTYLYANFTFVRRLSSALVNVYVPSILVVCLSWISFWLDIEAVPARVTLGVTSLLTTVTQSLEARRQLPSLNYMTALDIWLFVCIISVFCSLLEFAISFHIASQSKKVKIIDNIRSGKRSMYVSQVSPEKRGWLEFFKLPENSQRLDRICRIAFPTGFSAFALFYWCYYLL